MRSRKHSRRSKKKRPFIRFKGGSSCVGEFDVIGQDSILRDEDAVQFTNSNGTTNCFDTQLLYDWFMTKHPRNFVNLLNPVTQEPISEKDLLMLQHKFQGKGLPTYFPSKNSLTRTSYGILAKIYGPDKEITMNIFTQQNPIHFILTTSTKPDQHFYFQKLDSLKDQGKYPRYYLYDFDSKTLRKHYLTNFGNSFPHNALTCLEIMDDHCAMNVVQHDTEQYIHLVQGMPCDTDTKQMFKTLQFLLALNDIEKL